MADAGMWTPSFVTHLAAAHQQNVQYFESAMQMGIDMIMIKVAAEAGSRVIIWTYDKVSPMTLIFNNELVIVMHSKFSESILPVKLFWATDGIKRMPVGDRQPG